jgi:lysine-ketoglutarate reductase/saccharopine dehydrogenase-like protein (TIGR00300 family)
VSSYAPPDFEPLRAVPEARFDRAPAEGVAPEGFFPSSNLPTYVKVAGRWVMPERPRMDCVLVRRGERLLALGARHLRAGELVALGEHEDGREGILVHAAGFASGSAGQAFRFMSTEVSRERPTPYAELASSLKAERDRGGYLVWVLGPAVVHARARADVEWLITNGYVQAVLAGNAVAAHDIEAALYGTTLGMQGDGLLAERGHGLHLRAINRVRAAGSVAAAVEQGLLTSGIMHALVTQRVPFVLAGSIRDDGPLPEVLTDALAAQDAMREHTTRATGAVLIATALHAIAVGNQLPAFHTHRGEVEPMLTVCVDQTEFVVNKLKDRGTQAAFGVVTNAQDFLHVLKLHLSGLVRDSGA